MSLLNKKNTFSVRDFLFAAVGVLCLFGFFMSYPSQEPRSVIDTELTKKEATYQFAETLNELGYSTKGLRSVVKLESNEDLLDSLQSHFGRPDVIAMLADSVYPGIYPYYWEMDITSIAGKDVGGAGPPMINEKTILKLDEGGNFIEFINENNVLPNRAVNRDAIIAAFKADPEMKLWEATPDSVWRQVLRFDINGSYQLQSDDTEKVDTTLSTADSHTYSTENIEKLAAYHINKSGWSLDQFTLSDIQIESIHSKSVAQIEYRSEEPLLGQDVKLNLTLLPTGSLVEFEATYNSQESKESSIVTLDFVRAALVILIALLTITLLYFRIRARAVDTKPALVVGVLGGLLMAGIFFLEQWASIPSWQDLETTRAVGMALQIGFVGAVSSIGFFVVFAVGDSIIRQYWPGKLYSYDYLRQGMFFNKPIGEMILRSVILSFILCGIWSGGLALFPNLYIEIDDPFLHYEAVLAPLTLFMNSAWVSLILVMGIFAVVGAQIYGYYNNRWVAGGSIVVILGIVSPFIQDVGPMFQEIILAAIFGIIFTAIFLKWDLLTTFFTHLLFLLMIGASTGWIVEGSPDLYVFIVLCGFLVFNIVAGLLFITKGEEQQSLPHFVPEYVEELAQEERIKQELQIAREVQQSFLPVETPEFEQLELAAICKPAHETGGDYYDFVQLDKHRVAVTIGDVSGKGIQAAFYMTFIKGILHSLCRETDSPAEVLKKTNRLFCDNAPRGTFISLVYGIIDLQEQTFHFARAGHNPVLKLNGKNHDLQELRPEGIGIGLAEGTPFDNNIKELELEVCSDDVLILYTDGIVEALNEDEEFYGAYRLNKVLQEYKRQSAAQLLQKVSQEIYNYMGDAKQHDDMTMVVMKLN